MANFKSIFGFFVLVLVLLTVLANAQQQNGGGGKRQKAPQKQQQQNQQQQHQRPQPNQQKIKPKPNRNPAAKPANTNDSNDKPKSRRVTVDIPKLGRVRGRLIKTQWSGKSFMQFLDIPYAKSPVGPLRFKPSVPVAPWTDVILAHKPHSGCPSVQNMRRLAVLEQKNIDIEDCLRLSISSKLINGTAPVMVYIHGDFLYDGSSLEASPGYMLEEDIVLVSVRYRLGPFGFMSTMSEDIPGNAAVHDIITALQWIQSHIAAFGGDASRVTLFGQVGGSAMINILTMSPKVPEGLFHRVIYHSGSALSPALITDRPLAAAKDIGRIAGCKNVQKVDALNKCMRRLNTTALLTAFNAHGDNKVSEGVGGYGAVQFVIGGPSGVLPQHPGKLLAAENYKAYPTMGGSVKNGGSFILKDIYYDNWNETIVDDVYDGLGYIDQIIKQTNGADPTGAWKKFAQEEIFSAETIKNGSFYKMVPGLIDLCSTIAFKNPVLLAMQANAKKLPNSTYLYSFEYAGELNRYDNSDGENGMPFEMGVSLTDDNLYLFSWPMDNIINSNRDIKIAKRMVALWTSFANNGVPRAPGLPEWPSMSEETGPYMKIGTTVSFGDNYLDEYSSAVKDVRKGYNLVNDEFFESLELIEEGNEDEGEDVDDADEEDDQNEGRSDSHVVLIAKRTKMQ